MRLIADLKRRLDDEQSYFRQHLAREDIARLERAVELARAQPSMEEFLAAAAKIGWTPEDRRTFELKATLEPLLTAMHARATAGLSSDRADALDNEIETLWRSFEQHRMDRLVGCLARVPRPDCASGT